ncbi:hypothetical protein [Kitasatospora sp. NPDC058478]|uniref:hypothetical protein n=1 Tax=unclassified Kitasatospora TaxID=2633591 RepID=UPI003655714B
MADTTVLLTIHGQQHIPLDPASLAGKTVEQLDDLFAPYFDQLDIRTAVVLPDGTTIPLAPAPLPGPDIQALAIAAYENVVDAKRSGPIDAMTKLLHALGIDPDQIPPF